MANILFPLSLAAALAGGLGYGLINSPTEPPGQPVIFDVETHKAHAKQWMVKNIKTDDICLIEKTAKVSANTSTVEVDPACQTVFNAIDQISVWQQDGLGNVALANEQGFPVLEFQILPDGDLKTISMESGNLTLSPES